MIVMAECPCTIRLLLHWGTSYDNFSEGEGTTDLELAIQKARILGLLGESPRLAAILALGEANLTH